MTGTPVSPFFIIQDLNERASKHLLLEKTVFSTDSSGFVIFLRPLKLNREMYFLSADIKLIG